MKTKIKKWGNSLGVRIPKTFIQETQLTDGSSVDIKISGKNLVIKPLRKNYDLKEMLGKISKKNIHQEIFTGPAVGQEVW